MKEPLVAVIIITYNAMHWLERTILPLAKVPEQGIVYIIDNGSTDGTKAYIKENCPMFKFYQSPTNLGFGKANNIGLNLALHDGCTHFLLLNQDAHISWGNIKKLVSIQVLYNEFGILSPVHLHAKTKVDKKHLRTIVAGGRDYINDLITGNSLKSVYEVGYTNAAIWLISKACLQKVGGFDPLFPHYGEDSDYANRVNFLGFKLGLCPAIKGFHLREQETKKEKTYTQQDYFVRYLVQAKDLNLNATRSLLSIFLHLVVNTLGHLLGFHSSVNWNSWKAYLQLVRNYRHLEAHRKLNLKKAYCFLDIE